jgi:hypothetical protein
MVGENIQSRSSGGRLAIDGHREIVGQQIHGFLVIVRSWVNESMASSLTTQALPPLPVELAEPQHGGLT